MNTSHESPGSLPPGHTRSWWIFLAAATLVAALLRMSSPSRIAVEHFDEGVYASNVWCPDEDYSYPDRHLYAPPGLPRIIEEIHLWFQASDLSSIAPSLLAGILLVPLLGLLARDWLGEPAARSAALLAVFSDVHILYSRTALTDVTWITWLVLALWLSHRAILTGRPALVLAAGLATAAGWWTKYTGWLPLAIAVTGIVLVQAIGRRPNPEWTRWLKRLAVITAITAIAISPLFVLLQSTGGYTAVTDNHARYVVGLAGWFESAVSQANHMAAFESLLTVAGVALACCLSTIRPECFTWNAIRPRLPMAVAAAGLVAIASFPALVLAAAASTLRDAVTGRKNPGSDEREDRSLAWAMLAAWWISMTLTIPLYHAYPRLMLPWLVAGWLLLGRQLARYGAGRSPGTSSTETGRFLPLVGLIGAVLLLVAIPSRFVSRGIPALEPRTAIADLADEVVAVVTRQVPEGEVVIRVWGEPALFFQLSNRSPRRLLMQPAGGLKVIREGESPPKIPVFLAFGPHALDGRAPSPDLVQDYELQETFQVTPGLQVRRNQPPARRDQPMTFHLYRWQLNRNVSRETPQATRRSSTRTTR